LGTCSSSPGLACTTLPNQTASACVNPSILFAVTSSTLITEATASYSLISIGLLRLFSSGSESSTPNSAVLKEGA
jgi:hypothetical protein